MSTPLVDAMASIGYLRPPPERRSDEHDDEFEARLAEVEAANRARSAAARILSDEMVTVLAPQIQRRFAASMDEIDDAIQIVLDNLCRLEKGKAARQQFQDDSHVRNFLRVAIRRNLPVSRAISAPPEPGVWDPAVEDRIEHQRLREMLEQTLAPRVSDRLKRSAAKREFQSVVANILAIFDGQLDMARLIEAERESGRDRIEPDPNDPGAHRNKLVNRIHKRFSRALANLGDGIEELVAGGEISEERGQWLRRFVGALALRVNRMPHGMAGSDEVY